MQPLVAFLEPLDAVLEPYIEYVILGLVLVNLATRRFAYDRYAKKAEEGGEDAVSRNPLHELSNVVLVLASLYFLTLHHHAGVVLSVLVIGLFITDYFEFEARLVEARKGEPLEQPKAALVASVFVFLYAAYESVFFVIKPIWEAVI